MEFSHTVPPNYWYYQLSNTNKRWHRYNFAKHTLKTKLNNFDPQLTEYQNMLNHGYERVWDCGNLCYITTFD